jgi:hypothetical protein
MNRGISEVPTDFTVDHYGPAGHQELARLSKEGRCCVVVCDAAGDPTALGLTGAAAGASYGAAIGLFAGVIAAGSLLGIPVIMASTSLGLKILTGVGIALGTSAAGAFLGTPVGHIENQLTRGYAAICCPWRSSAAEAPMRQTLLAEQTGQPEA